MPRWSLAVLVVAAKPVAARSPESQIQSMRRSGRSAGQVGASAGSPPAAVNASAMPAARSRPISAEPGGGTDTREQFGPAGRRFGKLLKVNLHGIKAVADFPAFEEANNPDGGAGAFPGEEIDSNPNGLLVRQGARLVTDAGGNDLLKVDHKGRIKVVAVFPTRTVPAPPIPDLPPEIAGRLWRGRYRGQSQKWLAFRYTGRDGDIRVIDESGEDYLYPASSFVVIKVPQEVERAILHAS